MTYEIHHYCSDLINIYSKAFRIYIEFKNRENLIIEIPHSKLDIFSSMFRILTRLFRTDKCNVFVINETALSLLIIRRGAVYYFSEKTGLIQKFQLKNCRNLMHIDLCRLPNGTICFGEYGNNQERNGVPIYISKDNGESWEIIYEFKPEEIKHIHNIQFDSFSNTIWCCTGDLLGECKLVNFDLHFNVLKIIGDGSQFYRTCRLFFKQDSIFWLMDSHIETSYVIKFHRQNESIEILQDLPGPIWYSTTLSNGQYLAASSVEHGYSLIHKKAHLLISDDLEHWESIQVFKKDYYYPLDFFKYGAIGFPIGEQNINQVNCYGEALINFDGKIKTLNLSNFVNSISAVK
jgi:hypothetical protein